MSVCLFVLCRLNRWTDLKLGPSYLGGVRRSRSKVKVTKVKNVKFQPSFRKDGPRSKSQGSKVKVVGQGHTVKVKVVWEVLCPIDLREVDTWSFLFLFKWDLIRFQFEISCPTASNFI